MRAAPMPAQNPNLPSPSRAPVWDSVALFTPHAGWMALFAVAASFVLPFEGFGFDICGIHRLTGLPCPGCGLTRAFVSVAHGDWSTALGANAFVVVLYPLFVALGTLVLLPSGMRRAVERWLARESGRMGQVYRVGLAAFVGFGSLRFAWFLFSGEWFP